MGLFSEYGVNYLDEREELPPRENEPFVTPTPTTAPTTAPVTTTTPMSAPTPMPDEPPHDDYTPPPTAPPDDDNVVVLDGDEPTPSDPAVGDVTVQDLYSEMPEGGSMDVPTVGTPTGANITQADINTGNVATPTDAVTQTGDIVNNAINEITRNARPSSSRNSLEQQVDAELARILGRDSPLLASARQEAMRQMNTRGLTNTSMAAGATYGAMVNAAMPMAQQNAQQEFERSLENARLRQEMNMFSAEQTAQLRALEAELGQELSITNADQLAQAERLTAELRTALEQGNMEAYNRAAEQLAQLERDAQKQQADLEGVAAEREFLERQAYEELLIEQATQLNRQYMVGEQNIDIQHVIGQYAQIRSVNESAVDLTTSYINSVAAIYDNPDMSTSQANQAIRNMTTMYEGTMEMLRGINDMDLDDSGGGDYDYTEEERDPALDIM